MQKTTANAEFIQTVRKVKEDGCNNTDLVPVPVPVPVPAAAPVAVAAQWQIA